MFDLQRLPDWESRLSDLIDARFYEPIDFGFHDCCLWAADIVLALTGEDFGAPFRGKYSTAAGAAQALRDFGAGTMIRTFDAHLPRRPKAMLRRGDLVLVGKARTSSIGGVIGGSGLFVEENGLMPVDRSQWSRDWGWGVG